MSRKKTNGKWQFLRRTMLAGVLVLLPLFATYILVSFLFRTVSRLAAPWVGLLVRLTGLDQYAWLTEWLVPIVNLVLSLAFIFLVGLAARHFAGKWILRFLDDMLLRIPIVKSIYGAVKQMIDTFQGPGRSFQRVVLVQYPSKGFWMMGFVAAERPDGTGLTASGKLLSVFIPTTPNPTSGFLALVSPEDVVDIDYSVEDAFKFIVSSGIVGDDFRRKGA